MTCIVMCVWKRGGYGRSSGGTRVVKLAAESQEATLGYGARSTSTNMLTSRRPKGGQHDTNNMRIVATRGVARSGGGDPHD
jgi:hypothetical protein